MLKAHRRAEHRIGHMERVGDELRLQTDDGMLQLGLVDKIHPFRSNHRDSNKKQTPPGVIQYTLSSF